ncbi:MAG TPA: serine/threonine-protein kinase [Urbifossiella sp.]|nr:serine/threonine-protein kinase [Urbifossiella sp.]
MPPPPDVTSADHPLTLGKYEVLGKIAEGGMGTVYKCRDPRSGELVAVKVISPGTARNPVVLQRFEREFTSARVLEHPNVVRAIEYCGTGPNPFLVMEFVDGESIGQMVERAGPMAEDEAVRLIGQVCDGLQRAHKQGLIHRDVKPDNVLVTKAGVAKLTDMGLVKDVEGDTNLTKTGRGLGTPHYMAPEQFRNAKGVDARGDVYSLGATLYCMVTGVVPFANSNPLDCWMKKIRNEFPPPRELNPAVSERVDWAIRRSMSADPANRPSSCREFFEDLTGQSRPSGPVKPGAAATAAPADNWYLVYRDENNQPTTVKGTTPSIRDALKNNLLGDPNLILVGRSKTGQFVPLGSAPEFRDLVVAPAALGPDGKPSGVPRRPVPVPTPRPASDPTGEALDMSGRHPRPPAPPSGRYVPAPGPKPRREAAAADDAPAKKIEWTTLGLMVLVAVLSGVIGYLLLTR